MKKEHTSFPDRASQDGADRLAERGKRGVSRRGLLAGGAASGAVALPILHGLVPHQGLHDAVDGGDAHASAGGHGEAGKAAHGGGTNGPTVSQGATVDHAANGFNPTGMLR